MFISKLFRVIFFLSLSSFLLSGMVWAAEPLAWPKPVADEGNFDDPPEDGPGGSPPPPEIVVSLNVPPGGTEPTALQRGVWQKEELMVVRESGRGLPVWVVWFEALKALYQ